MAQHRSVAGQNADKRTANKRCAKCEKKKGPSRSCFPAGTLVQTLDGPRSIEAIAEGDTVWSFDFETGRWRSGNVAETYVTEYVGDLITLAFGSESIRVTGGHPFWVVEGEALTKRSSIPELAIDNSRGMLFESPNETTPEVTKTSTQLTKGRWVFARDLRANDMVLSLKQGILPVLSVEIVVGYLKTYNFHVGGWENYGVGETTILVHNLSIPNSCKIDRCEGSRKLKLKIRCKKLAKSCKKGQEKPLDNCAKWVAKVPDSASGRLTDDDKKHCSKLCCPAKRNDGALIRSLGANPFDSTGYVVKVAPHHIVPVILFGDEIGIEICEWGIDLNSAQNGVWLPGCLFPDRKAALHTGGPPASYEPMVRSSLRGVANKWQALSVIDDIRTYLLNNPEALNKPSPRTKHCPKQPSTE